MKFRVVSCRDVNPNHRDGPHEDCHYLNSEVRQQYGGTGNINAAYIGNGCAAIFFEPNIKLSHIAVNVPRNLRGSCYNLYLLKQQKYWNNEPLYVLDEWSAYMARERIKQYRDTSQSHNLYCIAQFMVYSYVLTDVIRERDKNYKEIEELEDFVRYMTRWTLYYIGEAGPNGNKAKQYLRNLK